MAQLFFAPVLQVSDANGVPYSGALAYFYDTGTSNARTSYQDSGLTTPHANPVVADSSGMFAPIYLADGTYKVVIQTSAGVTIRTVDPIVSAPAATASITGSIFGLTLSNNAGDATNDIDIATGSARDGADTVTLTLSASLTKRLDAAWAVGTNQGGLDSGAIANTTYHVWLIRRSDTNVVDVLFSTQATSPTMPTSYDSKRRIGSIVRSGAAIVAFKQLGDEFLRSVPAADVVSTNPGTSAVQVVLSTALGVQVTAIISVSVIDATPAAATAMIVTALDQADTAPVAGGVGDIQVPATGAGNPAAASAGKMLVRTNTAATIRYRLSASTADHSVLIYTFGWIDTRGRLS